jgi:hypothetical protein
VSEGFVYDSLGVPINEGDIVIVKEIAFQVVSIELPKKPTIVVPTKSASSQTPLIVGVHLLGDLTITCGFGKRLREVYKSAAVSEKVPLKPKVS